MTLADTIRARYEASAHLPAPHAGDRQTFDEGEPVPAAVLAAIVDRPEPTLLLTRRNDGMRKHAGQVAFPGGRADPGDDGPIATALREAQEEIALPSSAVTVIGLDSSYRTVTNYRIVPVVGVIPPDLPLRPREVEVADIFEVPLAFILDPANMIRQQVAFRGETRQFYEAIWGERHIWGATAAMIVNLARWLRSG